MLVAALASAQPAYGGWAEDFARGKNSAVGGGYAIFGGVGAGFFNALTGGAIYGKGTKDDLKADPKDPMKGGAGSDAADPGKQTFFPAKDKDVTPEEAQAKLVKKLPATSSVGSSNPDGSLALLQPESKDLGAFSQRRPGSGAGFGGPGEIEVPDIRSHAMSVDEADAEQQRRRGIKTQYRKPKVASEGSEFPEQRKMTTAQQKARVAAVYDRRVGVPTVTVSKSDGANALNLLRLANRKIELRDWKGAVEDGQKAVELDPMNAGAHESLAYAFLQKGDYEAALHHADKALELDPHSAQAHYIRALALEKLGDKAESRSSIERAAFYDPSRFNSFLEAAKRGRSLFAPDAEDSSALMDSVTQKRIGLAAEWLFFWLVMLILGGGGYLLFRVLRRRDKDAEGRFAEAGLRIALAVEAEKEGALLGGKYELARVIGKGGMGQVWEAQDTVLGRRVAVKKMTFEPNEAGATARDFCLKEARTLASLHHPAIVEIYEILDEPGGLYLVFELLRGKTVQHRVAEQKRIPFAQARDILKTVCEALEFAHGQGIVHRDLKPANIMVTEQGFIKVMDFGIARRLGDKVTAVAVPASPQAAAAIPMARTQTVAGTPAYMAPEAESGIVSPGLDVYSLGACLYEMITGQLPFGYGDLSEKIDKSYLRPSVLAHNLPQGVDALIDAALEPALEKRLPTVARFRAALEQIQA